MNNISNNLSLRHNIDSLRSLSQIFSTANFDKIIRKNNYTFINNRIKSHINICQTISYNESLKFIYHQLDKNYRCEYLYKNTLLIRKLLKKYSLNKTIALNEFKIGNSIADLVLLNGKARVFEIKTDIDGLDKLPNQILNYQKFADQIYIVTSPKYVEKTLLKYKNSNIGIIEFTNRNTLKEIKPSEESSIKFDHTTIFKTLRKQEYLQLIRDQYGFIPNVPNTQIFIKCLSLAKKIDIGQFQSQVVELLKKRNISCPDLLRSDETPVELKHICYSMNLSISDYECLYNFLNQEICC